MRGGAVPEGIEQPIDQAQGAVPLVTRRMVGMVLGFLSLLAALGAVVVVQVGTAPGRYAPASALAVVAVVGFLGASLAFGRRPRM